MKDQLTTYELLWYGNLPVVKDIHKDFAIGDIIKEKHYDGDSSRVFYYRLVYFTRHLLVCESPFGYARSFSNADYTVGRISKVTNETEKQSAMVPRLRGWTHAKNSSAL